MSFNDIFFLIVVPLAAILSTGLLISFFWKSKLGSILRRHKQQIHLLESRIDTIQNSSEQEDDISMARERLLFDWQDDLLKLLEPLYKAFGQPQVVAVDHAFHKPEKDQLKLLEAMGDRLVILEDARVRVQPRLYFTVGYFHQQFKNLQRAESYYKKAMEQDKTYVEPRYNLARLFQRTKHWPEAAAVFKDVEELRANDAEVHYGLGMCLSRIDEIDQGIDHLITAIRLNPENPSAYTELANAHARNGDISRGMEALAVALKLKPRFYRARLLQQELLIRNGDFETSIRECEKFLNQKQDGEVYFNLARAHVLSGDSDTGLKALRNAFQIDDSLRFKAKDDQAFEELKDNRRFKELIEGRLGLF